MSRKKEGKLFQWSRYDTGVLVSKSESKFISPRSFPGRGRYELALKF